MYITNIRHLIEASEKMSEEMPSEARDLIGFLKLIIESTANNPPQSLTTIGVECFEKGCSGMIKAAIRPDTEEIHWFCPDCENEGLISGWKNTEED